MSLIVTATIIIGIIFAIIVLIPKVINAMRQVDDAESRAEKWVSEH